MKLKKKGTQVKVINELNFQTIILSQNKHEIQLCSSKTFLLLDNTNICRINV